MGLYSFKALAREIRKLEQEISARYSKVEVFEAKDLCSRKAKIAELTKKFGLKHGWLYIIAPYRYTRQSVDKRARAARKKRYMSSFAKGSEFRGKDF